MTPTRVDSATIRQTVLDVLRRIAPEVSPDALQPAKPLRNQVDLDSMDWLNFLVALARKARRRYSRNGLREACHA